MLTQLAYTDLSAEEARVLIKAQDPTDMHENNAYTKRPHLEHTITASGDGWSGQWDSTSRVLVLEGTCFE